MQPDRPYPRTALRAAIFDHCRTWLVALFLPLSPWSHAHDMCIRMQLRSEEAATVLTVEDDGRGYGPTGTGTGLGLRSIEHRAAALGGTVHVGSAPGRCTLTVVEVPWTA